MTILLPMLMAYSLIGEKFHEIIGSLMFALFIAHHVINRAWFKSLFRGKYTAKRIFQTVVNVLLLIVMIAQPASGILMSKYLYTFIHVEGASSAARTVHMCLGYWGLVLMSMHAGMHIGAPLSKLKRNNEGCYKAVIVILSVISAYGCYAFVKRQLPQYMLLITRFAFFDFGEPKIYFFIDYIAIMILFAFAGYLIGNRLTHADKKILKERD